MHSFYGFPDHYYKEKFPNVGSKEVAEYVMGLLKSNDIAVVPVSRGLDHGAWACFKVGKQYYRRVLPSLVEAITVISFQSRDEPFECPHRPSFPVFFVRPLSALSPWPSCF